eukprot:g32032.t1
MIMFGSQESKDPLSASSRIAHLLPEEQVYLSQQSGTIRLDCFTHCLIVKSYLDFIRFTTKCFVKLTISPVIKSLYVMFAYIILRKYKYVNQSQSSYIIRNPQQRHISQSQPVRGRDEEQDDIVTADVEE